MNEQIFSESSKVQFLIQGTDLDRLATLIADKVRNEVELKNEIEGSPLISCAQACKMLGKSRPTLWRWDKLGYLVPIRVGVSTMYKMSDIQALLKGKKPMLGRDETFLAILKDEFSTKEALVVGASRFKL